LQATKGIDSFQGETHAGLVNSLSLLPPFPRRTCINMSGIGSSMRGYSPDLCRGIAIRHEKTISV